MYYYYSNWVSFMNMATPNSQFFPADVVEEGKMLRRKDGTGRCGCSQHAGAAKRGGPWEDS